MDNNNPQMTAWTREGLIKLARYEIADEDANQSPVPYDWHESNWKRWDDAVVKVRANPPTVVFWLRLQADEPVIYAYYTAHEGNMLEGNAALIVESKRWGARRHEIRPLEPAYEWLKKAAIRETEKLIVNDGDGERL